MKRLKDTIGCTKIYWDSAWSEWSVVTVGEHSDTTYFTDDKEDAYATAVWINSKLEDERHG